MDDAGTVTGMLAGAHLARIWHHSRARRFFARRAGRRMRSAWCYWTWSPATCSRRTRGWCWSSLPAVSSRGPQGLERRLAPNDRWPAAARDRQRTETVRTRATELAQLLGRWRTTPAVKDFAERLRRYKLPAPAAW